MNLATVQHVHRINRRTLCCCPRWQSCRRLERVGDGVVDFGGDAFLSWLVEVKAQRFNEVIDVVLGKKVKRLACALQGRSGSVWQGVVTCSSFAS